jgi:hypothetical protein
MKSTFSKILLFSFFMGMMPIALCAQEAEKPLPELQPLLKEIRKNLRSDRTLLGKYTYTQKTLQKDLDSKGQVKKTEEEIYEVYPSPEPGLTYHRLIARDGKPLDPKELEKRDRQHDQKAQEQVRKLQSETPREKEKRKSREAEERRKEELLIDELFQLYDIRMIGRETVEGHPAIQLSFRARADAKPRSNDAKLFLKVAGRAWFSETEYQMVRIEVELIDNISFGLGMLARLNKGAKATFQRRKVNDEIWLPAEEHFSGSAKFLLVKGMRMDQSTTYSDYRKFSVQTSITFQPPR